MNEIRSSRLSSISVLAGRLVRTNGPETCGLSAVRVSTRCSARTARCGRAPGERRGLGDVPRRARRSLGHQAARHRSRAYRRRSGPHRRRMIATASVRHRRSARRRVRTGRRAVAVPVPCCGAFSLQQSIDVHRAAALVERHALALAGLAVDDFEGPCLDTQRWKRGSDRLRSEASSGRCPPPGREP